MTVSNRSDVCQVEFVTNVTRERAGGQPSEEITEGDLRREIALYSVVARSKG